MSTRLIQVTNVSTSVTKEQLRALFSNLGRIEDIQLYPESETLAATIAAKVGYVKFTSSEIAQAALSLTSTVFIDRPILCSLVKPQSSSSSARIPDESDAVKFCASLNTNIVLLPSGPTWPHNVINRKVTVSGNHDQPATIYIETIDPNLAERSLPAYPPLPGTTDPIKSEEIRRTVYVSNLDPRITLENLHDLFSQMGEIKYIRMTKSENGIEYEKLGLKSDLKIPDGYDIETDSVGAYIEFNEQPSIVKALCLNGLKLANREIKVNHTTNSIIIPANSKEKISLDDFKKLKKSSSHRESSSKHESRHRSHKHKSKHSGSASDSSSRSSSEESVSSDESSPPRKQRRSSRSRSDSKSKTKSSSKSKRSRSREKDRKEKDREREKSRRSDSATRTSSSSKKRSKDDKDRDRDRDRERSSTHKKDKKEKRRSRDRSP